MADQTGAMAQELMRAARAAWRAGDPARAEELERAATAMACTGQVRQAVSATR